LQLTKLYNSIDPLSDVDKELKEAFKCHFLFIPYTKFKTKIKTQ